MEANVNGVGESWPLRFRTARPRLFGDRPPAPQGLRRVLLAARPRRRAGHAGGSARRVPGSRPALIGTAGL